MVTAEEQLPPTIPGQPRTMLELAALVSVAMEALPLPHPNRTRRSAEAVVEVAHSALARPSPGKLKKIKLNY